MPTENKELAVRMSGQFNCKFELGGCERYGQEVCAKCKEPFCPTHASEIDPAFCCSCLHPQNIELAKEPLVDEDGVTHAGARLTPVGTGFRSMARRIFEMTDEQLGIHIQEVQRKVKEAEAVLDFRRIDLASSEVELEERAANERRRLRGVKITPAKISIVANGGVGQKTPPKSATDFLVKLAKILGIALKTPEDVAKFASALAKTRQGK